MFSAALVPYDPASASNQVFRANQSSNAASGSPASFKGTATPLAIVPYHPTDTSTAVVSRKQKFTPSRMLQGTPRTVHADIKAQADQIGFDVSNTRYKGDIGPQAISNAKTSLADNSAVFIRSLPADIKDSEVFDTICEGKVFTYNKKEPKDGYQTCAVEISFQKTAAATAYREKGERGGVIIRNIPHKVHRSRIKFAPTKQDQLNESRILILSGRRGTMKSAKFYEGYLKESMRFDLVTLRSWSTRDGREVVEFGFTSILGQSRLARENLRDAIRTQHIKDKLSFRYGPDPCHPREEELWLCPANLISFNAVGGEQDYGLDKNPNSLLRLS